MTGSGTTKNDLKPGKDGPATATHSSEQQIKMQVEAIATLKAAKFIAPMMDITSLGTLTEAILKHALMLAKPGQQIITHMALTDKKFLELIAVLIQHYSEGSLTELVNESIKTAMENMTGQIQNVMKEEMEKIRKENTEMSTSVVDMAKQVHTSLNKVVDGTPSYSEAAAGKMNRSNPSFFAHQAIHV